MKRISLIMCISALLLPMAVSAQDDVVADDSTMDTAEPTVDAVAAEPAPEPEAKFIDGVTWKLLASGYYLLNTNFTPGPYTTIGHPYTNTQGFGANFVGGGASYTGDKFGLTIDVYYEPNGAQLSPISPLKQGYLSYMPVEKLQFDLGWFDTPFGAEVADEWANANYSRGALYFNMQPFNHLGLRTKYQATEKVGLTFLVVNGGVLGGEVTESNSVPSLGGQVFFAMGESSTAAVGYITGANGADGDKDWNHLIDVVMTIPISDFTLILNGDLIVDPNAPGTTGDVSVRGGGSVAGIYSFSDKFKLGLRGEYLAGDSDAFAGAIGFRDLITATATLRYIPVTPLVLSLEPRFEWSNPGTFVKDMAGSTRKTFFGLILGATVHLGNS